MNSNVTIVVYHYVRNLKNSRYPGIKGLSTEKFENQISYIKNNYEVISGHDFMSAISDEVKLPENSALLTFDDGYIDHFTNVFPVLDREGLTGCFFPTAKIILEDEVLDVNKIQFILASINDENIVVKYIYNKIIERSDKFNLLKPDEYWNLLCF